MSVVAITSLPVGHVAAAHWSTYILYAMPFSIVVFSIVMTTLRERREEREEKAERGNTRPRR